MTRHLTPESEALRERFAKVLSDHAIVPEQEGFHGWRCGHPDRYPGYCHCVPDLLDDLMAAAEARALPTVEALADALRDAVDTDPHTNLVYSGVVSVAAHREEFARHILRALSATPRPAPEPDRE